MNCSLVLEWSASRFLVGVVSSRCREIENFASVIRKDRDFVFGCWLVFSETDFWEFQKPLEISYEG